MDQQATIFVAGSRTLLGSALVRVLRAQEFQKLVGLDAAAPDLTDAVAVNDFFAQVRPQYVFLAAGKSGGIQANQRYPADLMLDNLLVACHTIDAAHRHGARRLLYLASSCSYPRLAPQPLAVASLLGGPLEPTNEAYAVAKIAGIKLCEAYQRQHGAAFITAIPANGFGPGDDFSHEDSHVIPAMIRKMHEAKLRGDQAVELWGTGNARREFMLSDDLADASSFVMRNYTDTAPINLGGGQDLSIRELAEAVRDVVGFAGELRFDSSKPDGMPLKALDGQALLDLGWRPAHSFTEGLAKTYAWFLEQPIATVSFSSEQPALPRVTSSAA